MTEQEIRNKVVATAAQYIGAVEGGSVHKKLIDTYNADKPLPRGYAMKYTDAWCAAFVTTIGIICKLTDIIFKECGCEKMIALYKNAGRWQENDAYRPNPGDVIFYDWDDNGVGDNTGNADHVGLVEKVSGNTITIIEGNYSDAVKRRTVAVNGRYIRGYGLPDYAKKADGKPAGNAGAGKKTVKEIAAEVINGLWGNGDERKQRLTAAGYNYTEVQTAVNEIVKAGNSAPANIAPATAAADPKGLWNGLIAFIGNPFGVAGLMGNIYAESGLVPNNLQNSGNTKTGMTDAEYTAAVDSGKYTNFVKDCHGFGLCQWTYWTRKQALLDFAKAQKASIGNQAMQIAFIKKELSEGYSAVLNTLKNAKSVREASDAVLFKFERPADQSAKVQECRAAYGQKYFDTYAGTSAPSSGTSGSGSGTSNPSSGAATKEVKASSAAACFLKSLAGTYTINANGGLNIRDGAGTSKKVLVTAPNGTKVQNYGYYTNAGGVKWLYVQFTLNGVKYTGFASSQYLKK